MQVAGSGAFTDCTNTFSLTPGALCNLSIDCTPQLAGPLQSQVLIPDNSLNANAAQSIPLSGTGTLDPTTLTFSVPNQTYGSAPFAVTASSTSPATITYSVVGGSATIAGNTVTITGVGPVQLQASQAATATYSAASATASFTVSTAATSTSLTGAIVTGTNSATLTATVAPQTPGLYQTAPTGSVTFYNSTSNTLLSTVPLSGGKATLKTPAYTGTQSLTAIYGGDSNYTASPASNASTLTFTVPPTITFTTAATYTYGRSFGLSASSNSPGAFTSSLVSGPATVTVTGSVTVTGEGMVTVLTSEAAAVTSGYTAASKQTSFTAIQATSTSKLNVTRVKSGFGSAASLSASVTPQFTGTPSGSVTFYDGATKLATVALSGATASYTTSQLVGAQHTYSAVYPGDTNFIGSTTNTVPLTLPVTAVSLQLLSTTLVYPLPPAFEIIVAAANGKPAPTGTVTVYDGSAAVATYPLYGLTQGYLFGLVLPSLNVGTHAHRGLLGRRPLRARNLRTGNGDSDAGSARTRAELSASIAESRTDPYLHRQYRPRSAPCNRNGDLCRNGRGIGHGEAEPGWPSHYLPSDDWERTLYPDRNLRRAG